MAGARSLDGGADGGGHGRAVAVDDARADDDADGDGAGEAGMRQLVLPADAAGALADGLVEACREGCEMCVLFPPETASMTPRVRPSAIGMAKGTAMRLARL